MDVFETGEKTVIFLTGYSNGITAVGLRYGSIGEYWESERQGKQQH
jgi:hypothetical protein